MKSLAVLVLLAPMLSLSAIPYENQFEPWFGDSLELETSATVVLEAYGSFATDHGVKHRNTLDTFVEIEAALPILDEYLIEFDLVAAQTRKGDFNINAISLIAGQQLMNDIVAEPLSMTAGVVVTQVFKPGLHNISTFYHGGIQGELDIALGKEFSTMQFWNGRYSTLIGVGIADIGYPWLRWNIAAAYNQWDQQQFSFEVDTLWGFGHKSLYPNCFHGYGGIRHQSIDLCFNYLYQFEFGLGIGFEYSYRAFARNCPRNASFIAVNFSYPIGLGI